MLQPLNLLAWGNGSSGQLAIDSTPEECTMPVSVQGLEVQPYAMAAGGSHTLLLSMARKLYVWGAGADGQLGNGKIPNVTKPQLLSLSMECAPLCKIAAGWGHSLAIDAEGSLIGWGSNSHRQINSSAASISLPVKIALNGKAEFIACGMRHTLCALSDGSVYAWGEAKFGQLGSPIPDPACAPTRIEGLPSSPVICVSAGVRHSVCLTSDGRVFAFGNNRYGQLGINPSAHAVSPTPVHVPALDGLGVVQVQCGWHHCIALTASGQVWGFGRNTYGQLASADTDRPLAPQLLPLPDKAKAIASGSEHTLVLLENGKLFACGWNEHGQLGVGDTNDRHSPVQVLPSTPLLCSFIASGYGHSFALFS